MRDIIVYTLMFSAMLQFLMAAYAWGRREEPSAKPFVMVSILGAIWALGYGIDIATSDLMSKLLLTKIYWTAASFGPFTFLLIVLEHLEMRRLRRWHYVAILIPSFTEIALLWTMPSHNLLIYDFRVEQVGSLYILQKESGILYNPIFLSLQGISIISYFLLIRSISTGGKIKRRQSITILIALLIPFLVNIPTILNVPLIQGFDLTPQALVFSSALFAFAIFRYRWLDILPLARTTLVETIPFGVVVLDNKNRIVDINPSAKEFLGVDDSVIGQETLSSLTQLDPILFAELSVDRFHKEARLETPNSAPRYVDIHVVPLVTQQGLFNGRILTFHDITERREANQKLLTQLDEIAFLHVQLKEQATHDPLTGLFNRRYMSEALERETRRADRHQHPLGILMIEIDDFKIFNDSFGHEAGDLTLQAVASLLRSNTRTNDIPCRFGGDEFILILPETTFEATRQCAERLRASANMLNLIHAGKPLPNVTLSIGGAIFPAHGDNTVLVIRAADEAMYRAKQVGKDRVVMAGEMS